MNKHKFRTSREKKLGVDVDNATKLLTAIAALITALAALAQAASPFFQ